MKIEWFIVTLVVVAGLVLLNFIMHLIGVNISSASDIGFIIGVVGLIVVLSGLVWIGVVVFYSFKKRLEDK